MAASGSKYDVYDADEQARFYQADLGGILG